MLVRVCPYPVDFCIRILTIPDNPNTASFFISSVTKILRKICATTFTENYGRLRMRGDERLG